MNRSGRYAPSPTGPLHLGNLRTALLAWLFARSAGSTLTLRIEDLDSQRVKPGIAEVQIEDMKSLGIDWDETAPAQSTRSDRYREVLDGLRERGLIYECFCTRREIREAASAPADDLPGGAYPGTCRNLTKAEISAKAQGRQAALRVNAQARSIRFEDRVQGQFVGLVDDFVVRRNDGDYAYNLAVAVDDADQGIGEVVRASDLLDSTPRQIWVAEQAGLTPPESWAHVPMVLDPSGRPMSKRHGDVTLASRLARGESAAQVRGMLAASLGICGEGEEPSMDELLESFDSAKLPRVDAPLEIDLGQ